MATMSITSNDGTLDSASAVLEVTATNPEYNQPALRIKQASQRGGAASIRIDDPNPDIEFVETDQDASDPAGQVSRLRFSPTSCRSMAAMLAILASRPSSWFSGGSGWQHRFRTRTQFGGGQGVIAIANATVAPSVNPAGGGILYVEDRSAQVSRLEWNGDGYRASLGLPWAFNKEVRDE